MLAFFLPSMLRTRYLFKYQTAHLDAIPLMEKTESLSFECIFSCLMNLFFFSSALSEMTLLFMRYRFAGKLCIWRSPLINFVKCKRETKKNIHDRIVHLMQTNKMAKFIAINFKNDNSWLYRWPYLTAKLRTEISNMKNAFSFIFHFEHGVADVRWFGPVRMDWTS